MNKRTPPHTITKRSLLLPALAAALVALATACGAEGDLGLDPDDVDVHESESSITGGPLSIVGLKALAHDGNVPANVLDGNLYTRWSCSGVGCWIRADLGAVKSVTDVTVAWYVGNTRVNNYVISVSNDDVTYTQVLSGKSSGTTVQPEAYSFAARSARYVRLTVNGNTSNTWASVTELRVYGSDPAAPAPAPAPTPAPTPTPVPGSAGVDAFGTKNLYPSASGARQWAAKWSSSPRTLSAGQVDPLDPEFAMRGSGHTLEIKGDGTARSAGDVIRMYIGDPARTKKWKNVELTVYGKRVSELSTASTIGFEFQTRTDDGHTSSTRLNSAGLPLPCDGKAYGFSYRFDGRGLMEKELKHPTITRQVAKNVWNGSTFPKNQWVGMKMVVYSIDGGAHVKLELWRDLTDGANGGTWTKVNEYADVGGWAIDAATAATCNIAPDHIISYAQPLVILRNDQIGEQWYKKVSIREIQP
jgi:hypothetical protein